MRQPTHQPQRAAHDEAETEPQFDSSFFVAFRLTHEALKGALREASELNITQYRILVKLSGAGEHGLGQGKLGEALRLKPNVVTQSLGVLDAFGFVSRAEGEHDRRSKTVRATEAGVHHIEYVNTHIVELLYSLFPTDNSSWRAILEASVAAGATIDPPLSRQTAERYPASRTLVSLELVRLEIERELKHSCGVPLSEALIMMRLSEVDDPQRIVDLAEALDTSTANVTRTVDRLARHGWVGRMTGPRDKKAVYVVPTPEGAFQAAVIAETTNRIATDLLWSRLSGADRTAIEQVGTVVIDGLRERRRAQHRVGYEDLRPMKKASGFEAGGWRGSCEPWR